MENPVKRIRQLDPKERELTVGGIARLENEIEELAEVQIVQIARKEYNKAKVKYEELIRPYNNKVETDEINKVLKEIESQLKMKKMSIEQMKIQLNKGVEVKDNKIVG